MCRGVEQARHGAAMVAWVQLDHVTPFKQGGATTFDNVVTACWACNYGKDRFAGSQIAIADPRDYAPMSSYWDGLVSLLPALEARGRADSLSPDT